MDEKDVLESLKGKQKHKRLRNQQDTAYRDEVLTSHHYRFANQMSSLARMNLDQCNNIGMIEVSIDKLVKEKKELIYKKQDNFLSTQTGYLLNQIRRISKISQDGMRNSHSSYKKLFEDHKKAKQLKSRGKLADRGTEVSQSKQMTLETEGSTTEHIRNTENTLQLGTPQSHLYYQGTSLARTFVPFSMENEGRLF